MRYLRWCSALFRARVTLLNNLKCGTASNGMRMPVWCCGATVGATVGGVALACAGAAAAVTAVTVGTSAAAVDVEDIGIISTPSCESVEFIFFRLFLCCSSLLVVNSDIASG